MSEQQLAMFDPVPPYVKGSETSKAAAESMVISAASLRGRILAMIAGPSVVKGWTCDEVEFWTELKHQTVSARIRELVQLGKIAIALNPDGTERTRPTRSGRQARVYVAVSL